MAKKEEQSAFLDLVDKVIDRGTDYEIDMEDMAGGLLGKIFKAKGKVGLYLGGFKEPKKIRLLPGQSIVKKWLELQQKYLTNFFLGVLLQNKG